MARTEGTKISMHLEDGLASGIKFIAAATGETFGQVVARLAGGLIRAELDVHMERMRDRNGHTARSRPARPPEEPLFETLGAGQGGGGA